jgi:hypothetical protein
MAATPTVADVSRSSSEADRGAGCEARREAGCAVDRAAVSAVAGGVREAGSSAATNKMPGPPPQQFSPLNCVFLNRI